MNLPENLSAAAKKVYELIANNQSPKSIDMIANKYSSQPAEEGYKAIATADSLVAKGIITVEKGGESNASQTPEVYTLVKSMEEVGPSEEADAKEAYAEKTDANEEEKRMMAILEQHGKQLPAIELFNLYLKGQSADGGAPAESEELTTALKELEDAGLVTKVDEGYSVKA